MYQSMSDAALIQRYKSDTDQQAAQVLYARYNRFVMQRLRIVVPKEEAEERASDIWRRFFCRGIRRYTPHTPFKHYLSTCAKTETKNYLRTIKGRDIAISLQEFDVEDSLWVKLKEASPAELEESADLYNHLIKEVIPSLTTNKRLVWLLRNEVEFYDANLTMNWPTLAQLNGLSVEETWEKFESTRTQLLARYWDPAAPDIDSEGLLIFIVWTHAQRPDRRGGYNFDEIASWLGVSGSTLRTRYQDADKLVAKALDQFNNGSSNSE